jgi:histidinol-phosphatase (PHP family)
MLPGDYHTHSASCNHAIGSLEEYVKAGISLGLPEIGLSDHFPMTFLPATFHHYAMDLSEVNGYIQTSQLLKKIYTSKIDVKIAFEVDFHKTVFPDYKRVLKPYLQDLDYLIGSVHGVKWKKHIVPIDSTCSLPDDFSPENGNGDKLLLTYYGEVLALVNTEYYDVLGHLDVIKKLGVIPEDYDLIWEAILKIIEKVEMTEMAVEINTSGLRMPENELYPSEKVILELIRRKVPMIFGSDAHDPSDVGYAFLNTIQFLRKNGLTKTCRISNRNKELISFL